MLFCLVHVYLYKKERRKHEQRSYAAMFMGVDPSYGSFLVKCLQSGGMYHASDMAVHPHTFPYRGQVLPQAIRHHHERLEGGGKRISTRSGKPKSFSLEQPRLGS